MFWQHDEGLEFELLAKRGVCFSLALWEEDK